MWQGYFFFLTLFAPVCCLSPGQSGCSPLWLAGILVLTLQLQSYEHQSSGWFNGVCDPLVITYYKIQKWQITWARGKAQKYCLAMLSLCCRLSINKQFDFLHLTVYCLTLTWWEAAANGYLHQKLPSHSRLERPHLFPANELLPSVKLQLLTFVLFKSKVQGSCGRLSAASRYPALTPWCRVEGERDHCGCCFVTGCLSGLWQGAYTEQPWPCMNHPSREEKGFRDLLETWVLLARDESMEMLSV